MQINGLINEIWEKLTPDGRNNVRDQNKPLKSVDLKEQSDPEAFTKHFLIEKILDLLNLEILPEKQFYIWGKRRSVDYILKNPKDAKFLMEAKPINADLFAKDESGAVNQIKGLFQHAKAKEEHDFGIATDGLRWVFINKEGEVTDDFSISKDFQQIKELLTGKQPIAKISEEEITEKFYSWYNALLHGGGYKDHKGNIRHISEKDSFVENIRSVERVEDREQIAQIIMDRLIFIKFLQSKGIIKTDVLRYISEYPEDTLVPKLRQLFFAVLNTEEEKRINLDKQLEGIPYLNGSLFNLTEIERKNTEFRVKAEILKDVINFLDSFKFVHREKEDADSINPEILGYIFERAMTALDRKGTGSYYTPKVITRYIAENTIYPCIIEKVNKLLKEEKGYRDTEFIKTIEELFILPATTLNGIWNKIVLNLKILDNACGSGAFLLQAANILFDLNRRIDDKLSIGNSDVALKKLILIKNIYGVDINPNAIEIAKLRLWLWLADSYDADHIEALPNIDYNLRVGNSLIGYLDLSKFKTYKVSLMDYLSTEKPLFEVLSERMDLLGEYKYSYGKESKDLRDRLMEKDEKIRQVLNINLYREFTEKKIQIMEEEFEGLNSFHWGFEFYDVFDPNKPEEERGFDVVIGNPPYVRSIRLKERDPIAWEIYRKEYTSASYREYDIYLPVLERSTGLLSTGGRLGFIMPNKWLHAQMGEKARGYFSDKRIVSGILNFRSLQVFVGATTYTMLIFFRNCQNSSILVRQFAGIPALKIENAMENLSGPEWEIGEVDYESISEAPWMFSFREKGRLMEKLRNLPKFGDYYKVYQGTGTRADAVFFVKKVSEDEKTYTICSRYTKKEHPIEKGIAKPSVKGRDIANYTALEKDNLLIFPYNGRELISEEVMRKEYPLTWRYLEECRDQLERREKGRFKGLNWYCYGRPQNHNLIPEKKIIIPAIVNFAKAALDGTGFHIIDSVYGIKKVSDIDLDDHFVIALLNSRLLTLFLMETGTNLRGGYFTMKSAYLEPFPMPDISKIDRVKGGTYHKIIENVKEIRELLQDQREESVNRIQKLDDEINQGLYKLYGLSGDEVTVVEEATEKGCFKGWVGG